jgi:hypothetical protein
MRRIFGILIATCGIALLALGVTMSPQVSSTVGELLQRAPLDRATMLLALGGVATTVGLGLAVARGHHQRGHGA